MHTNMQKDRTGLVLILDTLIAEQKGIEGHVNGTSDGYLTIGIVPHNT